MSVLEELKWKKFPVLNDGFVCLVDVMGDDAAVTQAARVSYGNDVRPAKDEPKPDGFSTFSAYAEACDVRDRQLIRYLMRMHHSTPFEMAELKFLVRVPMDCWRQWIRHRTANVNEYSTRYSEAIDSMQTTAPDQWRLQAKSNKQGSDGMLTEWPESWRTDDPDVMHPDWSPINIRTSNCKTPGQYMTHMEEKLQELARDVYRERINAGVAREQARKDLPLSTMTEAYWKIDLHNLLHFLSLRMDSHAQQEIREYATIIGEQIVAPLFPAVWEAFKDYRLGGMFLTRLDIEMIQRIGCKYRSALDVDPAWLALVAWQDLTGEPADSRSRERDECIAKLRRLGILPAE